MKSQKRGKGLIAEDHDWADASDSSDDEEDTINLGLMALNDEAEVLWLKSKKYLNKLLNHPPHQLLPLKISFSH